MWVTAMFATALALLVSVLTIVWSVLFVLPAVFDYRLQRVSGNRLRTFYQKIHHASVWTEENTPDQWVFGRWFVGYIHTSPTGQHGGEQKTLFLFSSKQFHTRHVQNADADDARTLTLYERYGHYWHIGYEQRQIAGPGHVPYPWQERTIRALRRLFKRQGYATCFVSGRPGTGKSDLARLLAQEMLSDCKEVSLVDTFNPSDPGDAFPVLYARVNPSTDKPLILVLEEVDGIIERSFRGEIKRHEHIPIQIVSKTDWNSFFDRFGRKYYPGVIVVLTSNKSAEEIDRMDVSYLREKRIDLRVKA